MECAKVMKKIRPKQLNSKTFYVSTGYGKLYITISEHEGKPFEVFCVIGKSGGSVRAKSEAIGRLVSLCLRNNIDLKHIVDQLIDISSDYQTWWNGMPIKSIPDAVGKVLKTVYLDKETDDAL
jgi:ribonucleoside-diphosphate reductase alpha chain